MMKLFDICGTRKWGESTFIIRAKNADRALEIAKSRVSYPDNTWFVKEITIPRGEGIILQTEWEE